jgi:hypothetical protein
VKISDELKMLWILQDRCSALLPLVRRADKNSLELSVELAAKLEESLVAFIEHLNELVASHSNDP